jgi:hypothetical protein
MPIRRVTRVLCGLPSQSGVPELVHHGVRTERWHEVRVPEDVNEITRR